MAAFGVAHRVVQQVHQHLAQSRRVPRDPARQAGFEAEHDVDAFAMRPLGKHVDDVFRQRVQVELHVFEHDGTGLDPRQVERVFDQAEQRAPRLQRDLGELALVAAQRFALEQGQHAEHGGERRAHLMAQAGGEARFLAREPRGFRAGRGQCPGGVPRVGDVLQDPKQPARTPIPIPVDAESPRAVTTHRVLHRRDAELRREAFASSREMILEALHHLRGVGGGHAGEQFGQVTRRTATVAREPCATPLVEREPTGVAVVAPGRDFAERGRGDQLLPGVAQGGLGAVPCGREVLHACCRAGEQPGEPLMLVRDCVQRREDSPPRPAPHRRQQRAGEGRHDESRRGLQARRQPVREHEAAEGVREQRQRRRERRVRDRQPALAALECQAADPRRFPYVLEPAHAAPPADQR